MRRSWVPGAIVLGAGLGYVLERSLARRWRASEDELTAAGLSMPSDVGHRFVTTSDGGRIHVVEKGKGPAIVLIHGITLGVGVWARQFATLPARHRVVAIDLRGHGPSIAGSGGYSFERLADDVLEVLEACDVTDAVAVGHSMGGMVLQLAAIRRAEVLRSHASGLVFVATDAGPAIPGPVGRPMGLLTARVAWRAARYAERHGKGVYPVRTSRRGAPGRASASTPEPRTWSWSARSRAQCPRGRWPSCSGRSWASMSVSTCPASSCRPWSSPGPVTH